MQERGIEVDHVRKAINSPDFTKDVFEGRILVRKRIDKDKVIEVVYCKEKSLRKSSEFLIITAY